MHHFDESTEQIAQLCFDYAIERLRMDPAPLDHPRTLAELTPDDRRVFDALVAWRLDVSRAAAVPAFVVFDNKVLRSVARTRPGSSDELLAVAGVGPAKLERYGAAVLEIVGRHATSPTA